LSKAIPWAIRSIVSGEAVDVEAAVAVGAGLTALASVEDGIAVVITGGTETEDVIVALDGERPVAGVKTGEVMVGTVSVGEGVEAQAGKMVNRAMTLIKAK